MDVESVFRFLRQFGIEAQENNKGEVLFLDVENNSVMDTEISKGWIPRTLPFGVKDTHSRRITKYYEYGSDSCIILRAPKKIMMIYLGKPLVDGRVDLQGVIVNKIKYRVLVDDKIVDEHEVRFDATNRGNSLMVSSHYGNGDESLFIIEDNRIVFKKTGEYGEYRKDQEERSMPPQDLAESFESNEIIPKLLNYYGKHYPQLNEVVESFSKRKSEEINK